MRRIFVLIIILFVIFRNDLLSQEGKKVGKQNIEELKKFVTDTSGVILGVVIDEATNKPLDYTTVLVRNISDSSLVNGGITNSEGRYQIVGVPWGTYLVEINYIGYKPVYIQNVEISKENPIKMVGKTKINSSTKTLEEFTVTGQKQMIQTNLDKKVFNVEQDLTSTGGSAVDALGNIPSVQVDIEGNVSIRGSSNITILVDGRPTNMTLEQIPAASIESIEVITNPSARFDPDGMTGIINVVLKKKKEHGFNGMASLNIGTGNLKDQWSFGKYNANINLNYRYDKLNITSSIDFRSFSNNFLGTLYRETDNGLGGITILEQITDGSYKGRFNNFKLGADYFFDKYNSVAFNTSYGSRKRKSDYNTSNNTKNEIDSIMQNFEQLSNSKSYSNNLEFSTNYKKTFETKGKELSMDMFYSMDFGNDESDLKQLYFIPDTRNPFYQTTDSKDDRNTFSFQTDYVSPIGNGGRLETGIKYTRKGRENDYFLYSGLDENSLMLDYSQLNNFEYTENLFAAYAIYSNTIFEKLKYQFGLRFEGVGVKSNLKSQEEGDNKKKYYNPFPTLHLKYEFNDNHAVQLSYSRRVRRPGMREINPFIDYRDRYNLQQGNPNLDPEFVNSIEASHYIVFNNKTSFNTTLFYRQRNDIITRITTILSDTTTLTNYKNLNNSNSYGLELVASQTINKWWKMLATGSFYRTIYYDKTLDTDYDNDYAWNVRLTSQMNINKKFDLQLVFNYRSPNLTVGSTGFMNASVGQGIMKETYSIDFGGKYNIIKDKLTLNLRASDIFGWWKMDTESGGEGFYSRTTRERESRTFWIGISYRFNDYKVKREKRTGGQEDEDM